MSFWNDYEPLFDEFMSENFNDRKHQLDFNPIEISENIFDEQTDNDFLQKKIKSVSNSNLNEQIYPNYSICDLATPSWSFSAESLEICKSMIQHFNSGDLFSLLDHFSKHTDPYFPVRTFTSNPNGSPIFLGPGVEPLMGVWVRWLDSVPDGIIQPTNFVTQRRSLPIVVLPSIQSSSLSFFQPTLHQSITMSYKDSVSLISNLLPKFHKSFIPSTSLPSPQLPLPRFLALTSSNLKGHFPSSSYSSSSSSSTTSSVGFGFFNSLVGRERSDGNNNIPSPSIPIPHPSSPSPSPCPSLSPPPSHLSCMLISIPFFMSGHLVQGVRSLLPHHDKEKKRIMKTENSHQTIHSLSPSSSSSSSFPSLEYSLKGEIKFLFSSEMKLIEVFFNYQ